MKKTLILLTTLLIITIFVSQAQTHFGISGMVGIPIKEFQDNTESVGGGLRANIFIPVAPSLPVYFGLDFGYLLMGSNTQIIDEDLVIRAGNIEIDRINIRLKATTTNNLMNGHAVLRLKAPLPTVQPYVDGLVGFNWLYTRTKVLDETEQRIFVDDPDGSNILNASTQESSLVFSYGLGGGVMLKVGPNFAIDLRGIYLLGQEAEYFDQSQIQKWTLDFDTSATYDPNNRQTEDFSLNSDSTPKNSRTDMFQVTLGIALSF